jgi:hypothetical protein
MHAGYCYEMLKDLIARESSMRRDEANFRIPDPGPGASEEEKEEAAGWAKQEAASIRQLDSDLAALESNASQLRLFMLGRPPADLDSATAMLTGQAMAKADIALLKRPTPAPASCYLNGETDNSGIPESDIDRYTKCETDAHQLQPYLEPIVKKEKTCRDISWCDISWLF